MTEDLEKAINVASALIGNRTPVTTKDIDDIVNTQLKMISFSFPTADLTVVRGMLVNMYCDSIDHARILEGRERREPWLKQFKLDGKSNWYFWEDYKAYLKKSNNLSIAQINETDRLTDIILDRLFDPNRENIHLHKKGMVVGQVQSGKTSNYTGLICKAADAGFDMIIVLAGLLNNLRTQTQLRLDKGFLGFDTHYERAYRLHHNSNIGVGALITDHQHPCSHAITTSQDKGDFTRANANSGGLNFMTHEPILMVVKKNKSVLTNLGEWLTAKIAPDEISGIKSVLVIDDEADNASINTRKDGNPSAINDCIRTLLNKFHKVAYVGYTATPFANIFIPEDETDLFPRDFIINLQAPSSYIGPTRVFGTSETADEGTSQVLPIVQKISDYHDFVPTKHKKDDPKPRYRDIPESLKTAVKSFILTCAVRWARGQRTAHNSMLIHVSRFQCWQEQIKEIVEQLFNYYKNELVYGDKKMIEEFRKAYEVSTTKYKCFKDVTEAFLKTDMKDIDPEIRVHDWKEVQPCLFPAVQKIEVKSLNGSSADVLNYEENEKTGVSVIAIGGDKLSRGLTLEGLSVSYFLRASKMYDTLMQMGRWFGYRKGYADLCRLYTSDELNEWFRHITTASEELRQEFVHLCDVGATPDSYRLQVRSHPGCLQITAANKMRYVQNIHVSWAGRLAETYSLPMEPVLKNANFEATQRFLEKLPSRYGLAGKHYVWKGIDVELVKDLLSHFHVTESLKSVDLDLIGKYISHLNTFGELKKWNVVVINKSSNATSSTNFRCGITVGNSLRTRAADTSYSNYCIRNGHIIGSTDELLDLTDDVKAKALKRTIEVKTKAGEKWEKDYPASQVVRQEFRGTNEPLLMIYTLDPYYANVLNEDGSVKEGTISFNHGDKPFVGFAISFPHTDTGYTGVSYTANLINDFAQTEDDFDNTNDNNYEE